MSTVTAPTAPLDPAPVGRTPAAIRTLLVVAVSVFALITVAAGALALIDLAARHQFTARASYAGVRSLVVDNSVGDVALVRAPKGAPVTVTAHVTEGLGTPERGAQRTAGGTLRLSASCSSFLGTSCSVGYTVAVPAGARIAVHSSGGDIDVRGYTGRTPLELTSSGGDIDAGGIAVPALRLRSSGGDVKAEGIRARTVDAESSAGDVKLALALPARSLTARSSAGDVRLTVPDVVYRVKASSSAGDVSDDGLKRDPHAPRSIDASSSAGDVRISPGPG